MNSLFFSLLGILASWPMLKSPSFGNLAGYLGILWGLAGVTITGLPILDVQGLVGVIVGIVQVIWLVVVGLKLWKLS